jgi:hypothetical protein
MHHAPMICEVSLDLAFVAAPRLQQIGCVAPMILCEVKSRDGFRGLLETTAPPPLASRTVAQGVNLPALPDRAQLRVTNMLG